MAGGLAEPHRLERQGSARHEAHVRHRHGRLGAAREPSGGGGAVGFLAGRPYPLRRAQHRAAGVVRGRLHGVRLRVGAVHKGRALPSGGGPPTRPYDGQLPDHVRLLRRGGRAVPARWLPAGGQGSRHQAAAADLPAGAPGIRQPVLGLQPDGRCAVRQRHRRAGDR